MHWVLHGNATTTESVSCLYQKSNSDKPVVDPVRNWNELHAVSRLCRMANKKQLSAIKLLPWVQPTS
jgi:hypothetical protein